MSCMGSLIYSVKSGDLEQPWNWFLINYYYRSMHFCTRDMQSCTIITPLACARGKVIGSIVIVVVISTICLIINLIHA